MRKYKFRGKQCRDFIPKESKTKTIRIKRILSEEVQQETKETCPHGMSYLLSCHQCDRYNYCNLLWKFEESEVEEG